MIPKIFIIPFSVFISLVTRAFQKYVNIGATATYFNAYIGLSPKNQSSEGNHLDHNQIVDSQHEDNQQESILHQEVYNGNTAAEDDLTEIVNTNTLNANLSNNNIWARPAFYLKGRIPKTNVYRAKNDKPNDSRRFTFK